MMATKLSPVEFFYEHAGYGYDPKKETEEQGKRRNAESLAAAERRASDEGLSFEWSVDPHIDSSDFEDSGESWQLWDCLCRSESGEVLASLGGIDFGRDGEPWNDPYRRVVEAELAQEGLPD